MAKGYLMIVLHAHCYGAYAPILCLTGVAVFGHDVESSKQVWSASERLSW